MDWNFVSSSQARIARAKTDWQAGFRSFPMTTMLSTQPSGKHFTRAAPPAVEIPSLSTHPNHGECPEPPFTRPATPEAAS